MSEQYKRYLSPCGNVWVLESEYENLEQQLKETQEKLEKHELLYSKHNALKEKLKTEFDTGYNLGVKEARGEIDKLRKEKQIYANKLEDACLDLEILEHKFKIAVEALEFYGNKKNYCYASSGFLNLIEGMTAIEDDHQLMMSNCGYAEMWYGGKRAREVLKQIKED